jgi:hypothetical protein
MQNDPLLSTDEIRHRLSIIRASSRHDRYRRKSPGMSTIAKRANLSAAFLYQVVYGQQISRESQAKLSKALADIDLRNVD